jgi:hypothetical protein
MPVYSITKAKTYGEKDNWQTSGEFRKAIMKKLEEKDFSMCSLEEIIDDVVVALYEMGHVILSW